MASNLLKNELFLYILQSKENERMKNQESLHLSQIETLQKCVTSMRAELCMKEAKIAHLTTNLEQKQSESTNWQDQFEIQKLEATHIQQSRVEEEKKTFQLRNTVMKLQEQVEKNNHLQVTLSKKVLTLGDKLKQHKVALDEKEATNTRLVSRVSHLSNLCIKANKHIAEDDKKITKLNEKMAGHAKFLDECNEFVAGVRKRESEILTFVNRLKVHYERKSQRCFSFLHRPSQASRILKEFHEMLLRDGDNAADNQVDDTTVTVTPQ